MDYFLELLIGGLTRGSIYALIALGYTMVYGIIELINFAHGEIDMIGAFTALIVASVLTMNGMTGVPVLILACLIAVIYASAYGLTVEKIAYRPLRQAPRLSPLISAIGMSIFLQNYILLAQTSDFLPFPNLIPTLSFMEPYSHIIGSAELIIILTTAAVTVALTLFIKFTRLGKAMRATAQDRNMALLVGVNVNRVISNTFIIGSALAAIGGVLIASHVGRISFQSASSPESRSLPPRFSGESGASPARSSACEATTLPSPHSDSARSSASSWRTGTRFPSGRAASRISPGLVSSVSLCRCIRRRSISISS